MQNQIPPSLCDVSIFGLGYVGAVTAACLGEQGHRVVGVDVQPAKVRILNEGRSPIIEPGLEGLLQSAKEDGRLSATQDVKDALDRTTLSIVCVGTPSLASGRLNLDHVRSVTREIAGALKTKDSPHILIYRSTMLPGSTRSLVQDFLSGLMDEGKLEVFFCPEFLREGSAIADFREPSLTIVGTADSGPAVPEPVRKLFGGEPRVMDWESAEMVKYACNYFHALKVCFANEIGRLGKNLHVDAARVMEAVCADTRLNISPYYLRPGNPFGGSCLPKDVSALNSLARMEGVSAPILENVMNSNQAHLDALIKQITRVPTRKVGFLGFSFKEQTDDLRGSPMVAVAETLLGRGYELKIYDPQLELTRLVGANEAEINTRMPHLARFLCSDPMDVPHTCDLIVASQACVPIDVLRPCIRSDHHIIDVNGWNGLTELPCTVEGFCR